MICPTAGMLIAARALSPALISDLALARITQMAQALPDCATGHILELRPAERAGRVDLSQAYLAGPQGIGRLAQGAEGTAALAPIAPFLAACAELALPLIWLEHDLDGTAAAPSLFFAPPKASPTATALTVRTALSHLPVPAAQVNAVAALAARLPAEVSLRQVGVMVPRRPCPVRLVLNARPAADIPGHLRALGWPGDRSGAAALLAHPAFQGTALRADLDVLSTLAPTLGLELPTIGMAPAQLRTILSGLLAEGAITAEAAVALSKLASAMGLPLIGAENDTNGMIDSVELRLNHLKMQLGAEGGFSVKAYLSVVAPPLFPPKTPVRRRGAET